MTSTISRIAELNDRVRLGLDRNARIVMTATCLATLAGGDRKIEDPSLDKPLYISAFRQDDGSYNIVWSRPNRRRDAPTDTAPADDSLPPLPGADEPAKPNGLAGTDGLGESSAEGAFGGEPAQGNGRCRRTPEMAD